MTGTVLRFVIVGVAAYLIGGIPWALVVGKGFYGIDVRTAGSGNLGATNVYRVLGRNAGLVTFALDALKGAGAVGLALLVVPSSVYGTTPSEAWNLTVWAEILAAFAVILGHSYSPYIGFKGGKGVATAAGALLVITPIAVPISVAIWVVVVWLTGMVSAGSIVIAALYPVWAYLFYREHPAVVIFALCGGALVVWRHRTNMVRIARGSEARVSWARRGARPASAVSSGRPATSEGTEKGRRV